MYITHTPTYVAFFCEFSLDCCLIAAKAVSKALLDTYNCPSNDNSITGNILFVPIPYVRCIYIFMYIHNNNYYDCVCEYMIRIYWSHECI